jgi:orotidine-5'-phosphate decarboxylase
MIIDRLHDKVKENGVVCVGLDTSMQYIPQSFLMECSTVQAALFNYNKKIIDATCDVAACFKVQIAYYEAYGIQGLLAYRDTLKYLKEVRAISIADIKRGDIANTAEMYAKAHFTGEFESDFVTLSPYMGMDSIEPYLPYVRDSEKGVFVLVRTSNKGAEDIQYVQSGAGRRVYNIIGDKVKALGMEYRGECGYSSIGGVVGCTHVEEGIELRKNLSSMFFLIPGYGAQGGRAEDVALYLKDGNGGVVNSSRAVLLAYKKVEDGEKHFHLYAREEVMRMRDEIKRACDNK